MDLDVGGLDPDISGLAGRVQGAPKDWRLLIQLQQQLASGGHAPRAAQVLDHLELTFQNVPAVLAHVGTRRADHQDPEQRARGRKLLETALSLQPSNRLVQSTLLGACLDARDWERAEALLDPGAPELRKQLADALDACGEQGEADRLRRPPPVGSPDPASKKLGPLRAAWLRRAPKKPRPLRAAWLRRAPKEPRPPDREEEPEQEERASPFRLFIWLVAILVVGVGRRPNATDTGLPAERHSGGRPGGPPPQGPRRRGARLPRVPAPGRVESVHVRPLRARREAGARRHPP